MKTLRPLRHPSPKFINAKPAEPDQQAREDEAMFRQEVRVICLYPTVEAGKIARQWIEDAVRNSSPGTFPSIEYFNYTVLNLDAIRWEHVIGHLEPDIILMVGDGNHTLGSGLRNSLRELFSRGGNGHKPLVVFRDLEPEPTINTRILLDYVSALSRRNHCELNAMNGNGTPIGCFRNPRHLLSTRRHRE
jgi:hypothetical protein